MIPSQKIPFMDKTPYHEIPMYKTLIRIYLPLITNVIKNNKSGKFDFKFLEGFPRPFPEESLEFKQYIFPNCFFVGCNDATIHFYALNGSLFIGFNIGSDPGEIRDINSINKLTFEYFSKFYV